MFTDLVGSSRCFAILLAGAMEGLSSAGRLVNCKLIALEHREVGVDLLVRHVRDADERESCA